MAYRYDIFISYKRHPETLGWIKKHFEPLLGHAVGMALGKEPAIFVHEVNQQIPDDLVKAINDYDAVNFIDVMCDERLRFLRGLSIWPKFGNGWSRRVADLRGYCKRLAIATPRVEVATLLDLPFEPSAKGIMHPEALSTDSVRMEHVALLDNEYGVA